MRVRRQSYLLFCLFPILMTILLNIKIKVTKKASSTVPRTFASHLEYLEWLRTLDVSSKHHDNCQSVVF